LNETLPTQPIFNKAHELYLNDSNSDWGQFAKVVYDQKILLNERAIRYLSSEGISRQRISYLINKETWDRVNCEVNYLQDFAGDFELKTIAYGVLRDIKAGGNYGSYWKAFKREEQAWISRGNFGEVQTIAGKEGAAVRFKNIVNQVNTCVSNVIDTVVTPKK